MDPISIVSLTANIVQFLDFGAKLVSTSINLYRSPAGMQEESVDIEAATKDLVSLSDRLNTGSGSGDPELDSLAQSCKKVAKVLLEQLDKAKVTGKHKTWKSIGAAIRSVWNANEVEGLQRRISQLREELILRLTVDLRETARRLRSEQAQIYTALDNTTKKIVDAIISQEDVFRAVNDAQMDAIRAEHEVTRQTVIQASEASTKNQRFQEIRRWLNAPDPSENFHQAIKNRYDGTGLWFIEGKQYQRWKNDPSSFIWLYGIPGCGKTILSSTVIQDLLQNGDRQTNVVAYFYFDFKDSQKQTPILLIKSLILQLCRPNPGIPPAIETLFSSCANGGQSPSLDGLLHVLRATIQNLPESHIVIDALDECIYRDDLMDVLNTICGWGLGNLHLLATSRKERDIEMCLEELVAPENAICLQTEVVDVDIRHYVAHILDTRRKFEKWRKDDNLRREIETALMQKSKGMFRWVVCQVDTLEKCLTRSQLRKALGSLPATLDETYDRILLSIDEEYSEFARRILTWLAFSARPLGLSEVAEVVAVDTDNGLDPDGVLEDPTDVMVICSTLVTITAPAGRIHGRQQVVEETVVLAHYSVKEYLLSDRIQRGLASWFALEPIACETFIAKGCLRYLLQFRDSVSCSAEQLIKSSKLALYAAEFWVYHARAVGRDSDTMNRLIVEFLICDDAFHKAFQIYTPISLGVFIPREPIYFPSPLYYAAFAGLPEIVQLLIRDGADINAISIQYGTPLCAAACSGDGSMVSTLLQEGADVNSPPNPHRGPLYIAARDGKTEVVGLLLQARSRVETLSRALGVAALNGHAKVAEMLLRNGANINLECSTGRYYSALQAAVGNGRKGMVELLLQAGADVNMQTDSNHGNALKTAIEKYEPGIMQLLFQAGVDVHAKCHSDCDDPLTIAVKWGELGAIKLLLQEGADVNGSNALDAATREGCIEAMALLLQAGANTNASTAVGEAVREDYVLEATKLLLQPGREANSQAALERAAGMGHLEAVKLLLQEGADINKDYALAIAAERGDLDVVRLLLQAGANTGASNALGKAAMRGHLDVVKLLLRAGADVSKRSALEGAARGGDLGVMMLLLQAGADVNGDSGRRALRAASTSRRADMVKLLLANGAGTGIREKSYDEAMQAASDGNYRRVVELLVLLEAPLFAGPHEAYKEVAELLLQAALAKKQGRTEDIIRIRP